jgi:hypothetical protein
MPLVRQNELDYKSLVGAVTSGRITAEPWPHADRVLADAGREKLTRLVLGE